MTLITGCARVYVYAGDWVADCPTGCGNVERVRDRSMVFGCSYCKVMSDMEWPPNMGDIMAVLEVRPVPHTRNWYPTGHQTAVKFGVPHGQTVRDLVEENAEHGI